jgi:hypothetical protein
MGKRKTIAESLLDVFDSSYVDEIIIPENRSFIELCFFDGTTLKIVATKPKESTPALVFYYSKLKKVKAK